MTIERALYSYLTGHATVGALLSTRVYPESAPTERSREFPYATYTQSSELPVHHMRGFSGLTNVQLLLDLWAETQPQREALAGAVQVAVNAWAPESRESVDIRRAIVSDQADDYVPPTDGSERGVYQRSMSVDIWYRDL